MSRDEKDQSQGNQAVEKGYDWTRFFQGFVTGGACLMVIALAASLISTKFIPLPEPDLTLPRSQVVQVDEGPLAGSIIVRYLGAISKPGVSFIEKEFEKLPRERPIWLSIQSGGGDVEAARMLLQYINDASIGLAIPEHGQCASACALLYAAATSRYASPNAYFGGSYWVPGW